MKKCLVSLACFFTLKLYAQIPTTDLQMWYKADAGYSSVLYPATWADQSGNGNDLKTLDFSESPMVVNDGANQALRFATFTSSFPFPMYHDTYMINKAPVTWAAGSTGLSVFMVYKLNSALSNATAGLYISGDKSSSSFIYGKTNTTGSFATVNNTNISENIYSPSNQKEIGSATFTPNASAGNNLFINGVSKGQVSSNGIMANTLINSLSVRSSGVGPNGSIDIYELIVYSSSLVTSDRQQVESYLGTKYGVTVVLPVRLENFAGNMQQNGAALYWSTQNEQGNAMFEIERSTDGILFLKIGSIKAGQHSYSFLDKNIEPYKKLYYRLKMIDADTKYTYSNVIRLSNNIKTPFSIFPNPAKNAITLSGMQGNGEIRILNFEGKNFLLQKISSQSQQIDIGMLPKGVYILQYKSDKEISREKFVKL